MNKAATLAGEEMIVLTRAEYDALCEDAGDAALAEAAKAEDAGAPTMPAELVTASLDGTLHPLTAWRKATRLTQAALAERAHVRLATVSDIEGGRTDPRWGTLKALAEAIGVDVDDIMP